LLTEPHSGPEVYPVCPDAIPSFELEEHGFRLSFSRTSDELDPVCHHLIIREARTGEVAGTYRLQISEMAYRYGGFYTADEFQLAMLPEEVLQDSVEIGRACVAREFRNRHVLFIGR